VGDPVLGASERAISQRPFLSMKVSKTPVEMTARVGMSTWIPGKRERSRSLCRDSRMWRRPAALPPISPSPIRVKVSPERKAPAEPGTSRLGVSGRSWGRLDPAAVAAGLGDAVDGDHVGGVAV